MMGLLHGLHLAHELRIRSIEIEKDSMTVVQWVQRNQCGIWYLEDF